MIRRNWHTQWTKSTNLTLIDTGRDSNIFLDNPIAAGPFLCLLFGRRFGPLHSNLPWKEEVTSRQEEEGNLEMSLCPEWRENGHVSFPALAAASSFHRLGLWCWRAEVRDISKTGPGRPICSGTGGSEVSGDEPQWGGMQITEIDEVVSAQWADSR